MKKILVMPDGNWLAHTSRPFEIAKLLQQIGYDVVFAGEGQYMEIPGDYGFQTFPIITVDPIRSLAISRIGRVNYYDYDFTKICVEAELKLFGKIQPDLVLGDWRHSLSTSCELAGIPLPFINLDDFFPTF